LLDENLESSEDLPVESGVGPADLGLLLEEEVLLFEELGELGRNDLITRVSSGSRLCLPLGVLRCMTVGSNWFLKMVDDIFASPWDNPDLLFGLWAGVSNLGLTSSTEEWPEATH
jgi:hypothetical protein